ncbi:MAG: FkbM family methyltransferase [Patescibacteria group bacterium]
MKIIQRIKNSINTPLGWFGFRISTELTAQRRFVDSLKSLSKLIRTPATVIDVGFASGTTELIETFSPTKSTYLAIDANPHFKEKIESFCKKYNAHSEMVFCGEKEGEVVFTIHQDHYKSSRYSGPISGSIQSIVPMKRLDTVVEEHGLSGPYLLKIDAEGAELDVLAGAEKTLETCEAVIVEAFVYRRFKNSSTFTSLVSFMDRRGFDVFDIFEQFYHKKTSLLLMTNIVFVKRDNQEWEKGVLNG